MGRVPLPHQMNFWKNSKWGVIFNPKIYVADFCHYRRYFGHEFRKKLQYDFPKFRGAGGQRSFGTFPKIHPFWRRSASLTVANMITYTSGVTPPPTLHKAPVPPAKLLALLVHLSPRQPVALSPSKL